MKTLMDLVRRLGRVISRRREEAEMEEELRFHLEMEEAHYGRNGLSAEEARRQARLAFGAPDAHREAIREARGLPAVENLWRDMRYGVRQLRRRAGSTLTVILVLALGIGANVGVFTYYHSAMNAPPPGIAKNDRLVRIRGSSVFVEGGRQLGMRLFPPEEIESYRSQEDIFQEVAALRTEGVAVELAGDPVEIVMGTGMFVSPNYLAMLGVPVSHGPGLPAATTEPAGLSVALISDEFWRSRFAADPDVAGRTFRVNGHPVSIGGVLPPGFGEFDMGNNGVALWMTLEAGEIVAPNIVREGRTARPDLYAVALLRPDVTRDAATSAARVIASRTPPEEGNTEVSAQVVPLLDHNVSPTYERQRTQEAALLGALTTLILAITCTNVSGLLVGIAAQRAREIAVRISLGATRRRLLRQLLTESALISVAAGAVACGIIWLLVGTLAHLIDDVPLIFDGRIILFSGVFALATGVLFGLSPALHATRVGTAEVLKNSAGSIGGSRSRLQRGLVVAQVALTQPLLVGVVGLVFAARAEVDQQISANIGTRIATISFDPTASTRGATTLEGAIQRIRQRFEATPGVVASSQVVPYSYRQTLHLSSNTVAGSPSETVPLITRPVEPGYLRVMEARLVEGRELNDQDKWGDGGAVVIGAELANRLWGSSSALNQTLSVEDYGGEIEEWMVVGVVDDRTVSTGSDDGPAVYVPLGGTSLTLFVRTEGPAEPMLPLLRAVSSAEAPDLPIREATTLARQEAEMRRTMMQIGGAVAAGGALALLLAAIGLYGVISLAVTARKREIGIRTAIGSSSNRVVGMFFRSGITLSAAGIAIGLPVGLIGFRLFAESENIPVAGALPISATIIVAVLGVAALASWVPARRAVGQDPLVALRSD